MRYIKFLTLLAFIVIGQVAKAQKYKDYEVKVITDSTRNIKGLLEKVTPDGVAVTNHNGEYFIIRSENIIKIKVRKRGLKMGEATLGGTGLGLAAGATIFFSDDQSSLDLGDKIGGTALVTAAGAVLGSLVGLGAEIAHTRIIILVDKDAAYFKTQYRKLLRYSKEGENGPVGN